MKIIVTAAIALFAVPALVFAQVSSSQLLTKRQPGKSTVAKTTPVKREIQTIPVKGGDGATPVKGGTRAPIGATNTTTGHPQKTSSPKTAASTEIKGEKYASGPKHASGAKRAGDDMHAGGARKDEKQPEKK